MQLQENMVVADRFRLVRMIGRGGMGSVWQAQHLGLDTPCAVKFIEGELANVAEAHARFEREAKAAAQLRSPHVVQIFDHGVWQGTPVHRDGAPRGRGPRQAHSRKRAAGCRPREVNTIIQQVCRALTQGASGAGIVHRDLKPDNIFLVNDDDRELVKILDFGVAKSAASQALDGSNTKTGAMLGTPYYMSPEQAQGIKSVDCAERSLVARGHRLPVPHRPAAVRERGARRSPREDHRSAHPDAVPHRAGAAGLRSLVGEGGGAQSGESLPDGEGVCDGAGARARQHRPQHDRRAHRVPNPGAGTAMMQPVESSPNPHTPPNMQFGPVRKGKPQQGGPRPYTSPTNPTPQPFGPPPTQPRIQGSAAPASSIRGSGAPVLGARATPRRSLASSRP